MSENPIKKQLSTMYGIMGKPSRCIDPVVKYCQGCIWGQRIYPDWVETADDLEGISFKTVCTLGYDKGRPEDEPTAKEVEEYREWVNGIIYYDTDSVIDVNELYPHKA